MFIKQVSRFTEIIKKDLSKDLSLAHDPLIEVKATFFRVFKIWWSLIWRGFFILIALGGLLLGAAKVFEDTLYGRFISWLGEPLTINGTGIVVISLTILTAVFLCYLFICLLFKLVIGKQYNDFRLDFTSSTPSEWRKICRASGRYLIILGMINIIGGKLEALSLNFPFGTFIAFCLTIISCLLQIYAIAFIVNRSYGGERLSLIKNK